MIEFKVSAPGKVILFGEHAVVHGKTALAASLDLRTTAEFAELAESPDHPEDVIKIEFPDINLFLDVSLSRFEDYFYRHGVGFEYVRGENNDQQLDRQVANFVDTYDKGELSKQQKLSLHAFFYLLICIGHEENINVKPCRVRLTTQLTINAGLGSSASFAVCLAGCFLHWSRLQKKIAGAFTTDELERISKYALGAERFAHSMPSGIDNSVCTYGSIIEFRRGEPVNVLPEVPAMKILLVDTKVSRNTMDQVARVTHLKQVYPAIVDRIFDSIDAVSRAALKEIGNIRDNPDDKHVPCRNLQYLVNVNQGLLSALNVSHIKLDIICAMARAADLAGKLTGAGGGGHAYILPLPETSAECIASLLEQLNAKDFSVTMTNLGCRGVRIE